MSKKPSFCIMIISHQRPTTMTTYKLLKETKCTAPIFIVVDDLDPTLSEYKKLYPESVLKIFSKAEMLQHCDPVDNNPSMCSALYPRVFCQLLAERLGYSYYAVLDDDIQGFIYRYEKNGVLASKAVSDVQQLFGAFLSLLDTTPVDALGFMNNGGFFGGLSAYQKKYFFIPNCVTLYKTASLIYHFAVRQEDFCTSSVLCNQGRIMLQTAEASFKAPARGTNVGGLSSDYKSAKMYIVNFYSLITSPFCCQIKASPDGNITLLKRTNNFAPKIIDEEWRKP